MIIDELFFWSLFILLNSLNYVVNYLLYYKESSFLPFLKKYRESGKLNLLSCGYMDPFRFSVELSTIILISRVFDLRSFSLVIASIFSLFLVFNLYQYLLRKIYEAEPVVYNDFKLMKNGWAIVWSESKVKLILIILGICGLLYAFSYFFSWFMGFSYSLGPSNFYWTASTLWVILVGLSVRKIGFYRKYPNDISMRFHFTVLEMFHNLTRSYKHYRISKLKIGEAFKNRRKDIELKEIKSSPNLFFLFIESYGSYYFREPKISQKSYKDFNSFKSRLKESGFETRTQFSKSPTIGGQSWLTYSSLLFGYRIDNNTLFENHLYDPNFRSSNSMLELLRISGYTNYNLNPISPISGINVPYEEMREMYAIDHWILSKDINYKGDAYGFGSCPPDQYSLNYTMQLIKKEQKSPFTLFYLTKNSHSPFITPPLVTDWQTLNEGEGKTHVHKGFLKYPEVKDYQNAIKYEYDVMGQFINQHGTNNDIFILVGDHQPPALVQPEKHGFSTPIHIVSKDIGFLDDFDRFGFKEEITDQDEEIRHESFYSIFLQVFAKHYAMNAVNIPAYEPQGIQL